jgi:hypothetical protein
MLVFAWHLWKSFLTHRTLNPTLYVIADSTQAVLTSRATALHVESPPKEYPCTLPTAKQIDDVVYWYLIQ